MKNEAQLRSEILDLVQKYYECTHLVKTQAPFEAGVTPINYAGRVFDHTEMQAIVETGLDFWLTSGKYYQNFEEKLAQKIGVKHSLFVNSGSSANLLAFSALTSNLMGKRKINRGDEIITVAAGFPTTVAPIFQFGAVPVFVDVALEDGTYNIDVQYLDEALSEKTKGVMIAHTLGNPFNLEVVLEFCKKHNLFLIEDNCDGLGSTYKGKLTGGFGDIATSSFYPAHHITTGEGGAIYTNSPMIKRSAESFRDWGRDCWCPSGKDNTCEKRFKWKLGDLPKGYDHKYVYRHLGYNLKATEMQAAIGVIQLDKLDDFVAARKKNFSILKEFFAPYEELFILPNATKHSDPSWFGFPITLRNNNKRFKRDDVTKYFESKKIQTRLLFAGNLLKHPAVASLEDKNSYRVVGDLKNTDYIMNNTFWIGVYPGLTSEKLEYIGDCISEFMKMN